MPKGLREIRNRIKSVKSTGQITRALQLVASSKMKRAQDSARAGRAYAELLGEILDTAQSKVGDFTHPLLTKREVKVRGSLVGNVVLATRADPRPPRRARPPPAARRVAGGGNC